MISMLLAFFATIIFSIIYPLGKITMVYCPPFLLIGLRMLCAGVIYLAFAGFSKKPYHMSWTFLWKIILLAIFNIFLTNACEFWGLQYMSSAKTAFIYNLSPFFSALFGYIHFSEQVTFKKCLGLAISFLGFIPIFIASAPAEEGLSHLLLFSTAELSLLIAAIATVYGWIIMQDIARKKSHDVSIANGLSMTIGAAFSFGTSVAFELPYVTFSCISGASLAALASLILCLSILTIIVYALYTYLLNVYTATFMTMIGMTSPLFSAFFDWLFFGMVVSADFYVAMAIVSIGLYLFYQEDLRLGYTIKENHIKLKL